MFRLFRFLVRIRQRDGAVWRAVITIDVIRRSGADVTVASVEKELRVDACHGVKIVADALVADCKNTVFDLIALPGGMPGASNFKDCGVLESLVKKQAADGRLYAAVCASPAVALGSWGLLKGLKATCYPSFMEQLQSCATAVESRVQQDGKVVTSRGPGTTMEFAVTLVEQLYGKEKADEVSGPLVMRPNHGDEYTITELNPLEWKCNNVPQGSKRVPILDSKEFQGHNEFLVRGVQKEQCEERADLHLAISIVLFSSLILKVTIKVQDMQEHLLPKTTGPRWLFLNLAGFSLLTPISAFPPLVGKFTQILIFNLQVLVPIADGSEEMEAVMIIDILRRAKANVVVASVGDNLEILASRKVKLVADMLLDEAAKLTYDLIVLPGGLGGAQAFAKSDKLVNLLKKQAESNKPYGAICASPALVLEPHGLLKGKKATAYPAMCDKLSDQSHIDNRVVVDGNLITSRGPGTAMEFALGIVEKFFGRPKALELAKGLLVGRQ
ncbi:hypothetical protein GOBAR_AA28023 [Gossypium barbadense]|uniref:DJ-1/PfpI domain-containing protein n=1 Tax=Gossypium barbadense TaxID=3634 RepID=A0A2P5WNJ0_GOSBA|nr:hypothetical protein GOBAR_AA28023 [Gossypium barbadense]